MARPASTRRLAIAWHDPHQSERAVEDQTDHDAGNGDWLPLAAPPRVNHPEQPQDKRHAERAIEKIDRQEPQGLNGAGPVGPPDAGPSAALRPPARA